MRLKISKLDLSDLVSNIRKDLEYILSTKLICYSFNELSNKDGDELNSSLDWDYRLRFYISNDCREIEYYKFEIFFYLKGDILNKVILIHSRSKVRARKFEIILNDGDLQSLKKEIIIKISECFVT